VAKRDGSAARARRSESRGPREEGATLKSVDGDAALQIALDRVIHERVRLAIVSALSVHESLSFNELKALLETSDGNVSVHARKLEDVGYVTCKKGFDGRIPRPEYRLTAAGRRA